MSTLMFEQRCQASTRNTAYELDAVEGADGVFSLHPQDAPDVRLFLLEAALYLPSDVPEVYCGQCGDRAGSGRPRPHPRRGHPGERHVRGPAAPVLVNESPGAQCRARLTRHRTTATSMYRCRTRRWPSGSR